MRRGILSLLAVSVLAARGLAACNEHVTGTRDRPRIWVILADAKITKPVIAELNGSQTDNNSTLFKDGYEGVLKPRFDSGEYIKGPDQWIEEWDNTRAGTTFEQMLTAQPNIGGVIAANDGL